MGALTFSLQRSMVVAQLEEQLLPKRLVSGSKYFKLIFTAEIPHVKHSVLLVTKCAFRYDF